MKPIDLYKRDPETVLCGKGIVSEYLLGQHANFNHLPELEYAKRLEENFPMDRVVVKLYKDIWYDTRRFWRLASVWFDHIPVMIIRNAGREGDDHCSRIVTDLMLYTIMTRYIAIGFSPQVVLTEYELKDQCVDIPDLTDFYGGTLD